MQVLFLVLKQVILVSNFKHWIFQEGSDNEEEEGEEEEEENTDYLTDSNKENETDEENTVCFVTLDKWIVFCIFGFLYWMFLLMLLITYLGKHGKNTPCYSFKYTLELIFVVVNFHYYWKYLCHQLYYNVFSQDRALSQVARLEKIA